MKRRTKLACDLVKGDVVNGQRVNHAKGAAFIMVAFDGGKFCLVPRDTVFELED